MRRKRGAEDSQRGVLRRRGDPPPSEPSPPGIKREETAGTEGWNIPEDLIFDDILTRLPVNSLRRFQSVCKAWHSKISNRRFIELHTRRSQPNICTLIGDYGCSGSPETEHTNLIERLTEEGNLEEYYRLPWEGDTDVVNSSWHLIVLRYKYGYMLSNPATRDLLYISHDPWDDDDLYLTGFGFVPSLGKYKVLSIVLDSEDICEVFTVGTDNSWRKLSPLFRMSHSYHMPYLNGNLHMLSSEYGLFEHAMSVDGDGRVVVFTLEEETWSVIELPTVQKRDYESFELRNMHGVLCFSCSNPGKRRSMDAQRLCKQGLDKGLCY